MLFRIISTAIILTWTISAGLPGSTFGPCEAHAAAASLASFHLETDLAWPDDEVPMFTAHASGTGALDEHGRLRFDLQLGNGTLTLPVLRSKFTGTARGIVDGNGFKLDIAELTLPAPSLRLTENPVRLPASKVRLTGENPNFFQADASGDIMRFQALVDVGRAMHAEGPLEIGPSGNTVRLELEAPKADRLTALLLPGLPPGMLSGPLTGTLEFTAFEAENETLPQKKRRTEWTAAGDLSLNGTVRAPGIEPARPRLKFQALGGIAPGNRSWVELAEAALQFASTPKTPPLRVSGRIESIGAGGWDLSGCSISLHEWGNLDVRGGLTSRRPLTMSGRLNATGLIHTLADLDAMPAEAKDWAPGGNFRVNARLEPPSAKNSRRFSGELSLRGGTFISPDARYMGLELGADLRLKGQSLPDSPPTLSINLRAEHGGTIFGPLLMEFPTHPLSFTARTDPGSNKRDTELEAVLTLKGLAQAGLNATATPDGVINAALGLENVNLAPLVRDLFAPALEDSGLPLVNGTASLHLAASGNDRNNTWDTTGRLLLSEGSATENGRPLIKDVNLVLPIHLRTPRGEISKSTVPAAWGSLTSGPGRFGNLTLSPLSLDVAWTPSGIMTRNPVLVRFFGGTLALEGMRLDDPFEPEREMELSAQLDSLDFSKLPGEAVPLQGSLSSGPLYVRYADETLDVYGSMNGTFYDGDMDVRDIEIHRPLTEGRTVRTDISISRIDLEPLSRAMGVGRVTGKLDLELDDFTMAYGQPAGFRLKAVSSPGDNTERMVSLQAVNTLSVIGTGSGLTDMGVGMFTSFFKEFGYSRIGMNCTLNNDQFRIRGLIHDGDVEYLIKKPLFFGVNVVNSNPDNEISFSDMLERVRRVVRPKDSNKHGMEDYQ